MTVTDSLTTPEQKKGGLKKLWVKVKAAMPAKPFKPQNTTNGPIQTKQKETPSTATSLVPQSVFAEEVPSVPKVEVVKDMETPEAKIYSVPEEAVVEEGSQAIIPVLDAIEVDKTDDLPDTYELPIFIPRTSEAANKKKLDQAQAVYEKYGIPLNITDWQKSEKSGVERVERKTRMRVRYTCHSCQTSFGRDKVCTKCSHDRSKCTECVRYPAKRPGEKARRQKVVLVEPTVPPISKGACHECKTDFRIGDKRCENCEHDICERCLRETILNSPAIAPPTESRSMASTSV